MARDYYGGIETDKVGELGIGYVLFYDMADEKKYLEAGVRCAKALAENVRQGDASRTPGPFRVDARTGEVPVNGQYGGMIVAPVRLFDEVMRLNAGDVETFRAARGLAGKWLLSYPPNLSSTAHDRWAMYFEDVNYTPDNVNQASSPMTANYIPSRPDPAGVDPQWDRHVGRAIDFLKQRFGKGPYLCAWAIDEQTVCYSRAGLGSDTSPWAAIDAMYYEKTGDAQAREDAFRSLNYATYFAASDGMIACCGANYTSPYWFDDGYSDYSRNFSWAMGAVPAFAPQGENHLLRSTSVV